MKKFVKGAMLGITVVLSAGSVQMSGATGIVYTETSVAGASFALDEYSIDTSKRDAVKEFLFGSGETQEETTGETQAPEDASAKEQTEESTSQNQTLYAVSVADNYVWVRSQPTTASDVLGKMYKGAVGTVLESVDGEDGVWYYITSGSVEGYVKAEFFTAGTMDDAAISGAFRTVGTVSDNTTALYVRSGPSVETEAITLISTGTTVVITGDAGDFWMVQLDETCSGYVHKDYITVSSQCTTAISITEEKLQAEQEYEAEATESTEAETAETAAAEQSKPESTVLSEVATPAATEGAAEVSTQPAAEPETTATPETEAQTEAATTQAAVVPVGVTASYTGGTKYVGSTVSGAELSVIGIFSDGSSYAVDGWSCDQVGMSLSEGSNTFTVYYQGYSCSFTVEAIVQQTTAAESTTSSVRTSLVNYALQFLGNPYVYGGTDLVNGTDCSGFTMGVYAKFGYSIPRTSYTQVNAGRTIALSDVQPGDLVFYTNVTTGNIGHVAIYIGNGQIIHAASETLGIIISDMYYRQPAGAVSIID